MSKDLQLLKGLAKRLCETWSPSGEESRIAGVIHSEVLDLVDEVWVDALGNLIAHKKGNGPKVMVTAHMDEIGVIITHIDEQGFLRFSSIGQNNPDFLLGHRCRFANGTIGVFGSEPVEPDQKSDVARLYIDIGCYSEQEARAKVRVGDFAVYHTGFLDLGKVVVSKALDNRVCCAVLVTVLQELQGITPGNDCFFVFTVQEEQGLRGAYTSAYAIDPVYGIALDVTPTGDTPKSRFGDIYMGKGPTVKITDRSVICHPQMVKHMAEVAVREEIPYQIEVLAGGGTDIGAIHITRAGVVCGGISIPWRHFHSASEMVDIDDVVNCIKLLKAVLLSEFPKVVSGSDWFTE